MNVHRLFKFLLIALCSHGLMPVQAATDACTASDDLIPLCVGHAEDIEPLPDHRHLLLSNYGGLDGTPGTLVQFDTQTARAETLYPVAGASEKGSPAWGDAGCTDPVGVKLSPHGIHLSRRGDGTLQLLVVNHGSRESVELFEVLAGDGGYRLRWRGCVTGPAGNLFNDVAALPDGGFVVTHMWDPRDATAVQRAVAGEASGHVWRWRLDSGFTKVAGSNGSIPNGIQTTGDGKTAFVNYSGSGELRKLDLQKGIATGSVAIRKPDNLTWTQDGRLLATSLLQPIEFETCGHRKTDFCHVPFAIYTVDPVTLARQKIFEHGGESFGAATVATQMGEWVYVGTFSGDRTAKFPAAMRGSQ